MNVRLLLVLLLACSAVGSALQRYQPQNTIDFYHYWAFANARRMTTKEIADPYGNREGYRNVLRRFGERYLAEGGDPRFRAVHDFRIPVRTEDGRRVDKLLPTGPPLLYAAFWFLPLDYIAATKLYAVLQMLAFVGGSLLLVHVLRLEWTFGAALALFLAQAFYPFLVEMRVGNVNALQYFATAVILWVAAIRLPKATSGRRLAWGALFVFLGLSFLLVKANVLPLIALLFAHFALRYGRDRRFALGSAGIGTALAALAVLWSSLRFGSWGGVWFDWWAYIRPGREDSLLEFARELGNTSPALLLRDALGTSSAVAAVLVLAFFALTFAVVEALRPSAPTGRGPLRDVLAGLRVRLLDPGFCAATGVLVVLSAMPLVWYHYYVLFPLPLLYAVAGARGASPSVVLAALATVPYFPALNEVFTTSSLELSASVLALPFSPLWIAVLLRRPTPLEPVRAPLPTHEPAP